MGKLAQNKNFKPLSNESMWGGVKKHNRKISTPRTWVMAIWKCYEIITIPLQDKRTINDNKNGKCRFEKEPSRTF